MTSLVMQPTNLQLLVTLAANDTQISLAIVATLGNNTAAVNIFTSALASSGMEFFPPSSRY